jgi:hypothetical protein
MSKINLLRITDSEDFHAQMRFIVERLHCTPSMAAKLPKYLIIRIDACVEYMRKNGYPKR